MAMIACSECGKEISDKAEKCIHCGNPINENIARNMKFCMHCGEKIFIDAVICPKCGRQVEDFKSNTQQQPNTVINNTSANTNMNTNTNTITISGIQFPQRSKLVTLLLCGFLGYLGVHRFYAGKIGTGILYLFTFGLGGMGIIVDLIMILTGVFRDKSGFPLV